MKKLGLLVFIGFVAGGLALAANVQSARAFGEWFGPDGACSQPHGPRVEHRTVRRHIVERPGVYQIKRRPGLYGWKKVRVRTPSGRVVVRKKRVLLRPYKNVAEYHEPRERWGHERQRITSAAPPRPRGAWPDGC